MSNMVYHYTSPEGIFNIIKNRTLWFTDSQFLNDKSELAYIQEPLREALEQFYQKHFKYLFITKELIEKSIKEFLPLPHQNSTPDYETVMEVINAAKLDGTEDIEDVVDELFLKYDKKFRYYILCTSENPDTSSMWNYYVKNGNYQGYNLGVNVNVIKKKIKNILKNKNSGIKIFNGKVVYDHKEQAENLWNKIDRVVEKGNSLIPYVNDEIRILLDREKFFFKNPAFKNEEEFRIILKIPTDFKETENGKLALKYRPGTSGIITPYIEWKFAEDNENISEIIKEITLAPMIEEEIAKEGFKRFLADEDIENIKINQSSIKLRF
jgi:hypothetical protein